MAGYIIANIEVLDPVGYEQYRKLAAESIAAFAGTFLVRGGETEILEGTPALHRLVIIKFESIEKARAWWSSPQYAEAKKIRDKTARAEMVLVEGKDC